MGSVHRMRCSMWRFSVHMDFLATGVMLQYSFAHGNETEGARPPQPGDPHLDHVARRPVGLRQIPGHEASHAPIPVRGHAVHGTCTGSEASLSRRFLQRMDQRRDTNEDGARLRALVRGCAVS